MTEAQQRLNIAQTEEGSRKVTGWVRGVETALPYVIKLIWRNKGAGLLKNPPRSISPAITATRAARKQSEKVKNLEQKVRDMQQTLLEEVAEGQAVIAAEEQAARAKYLDVEERLLWPELSDIDVKRMGILFR